MLYLRYIKTCNKLKLKWLSIGFSCIGTVAFEKKVKVTMFILMNTVIIICRGGNAGIANVETYKDRQGQLGTNKDRKGQTGTDRDRQGQAGTDRDRQGQAGTSRDRKGLSLLVPACPCLSLPCPCLSLPCPWHRLAHLVNSQCYLCSLGHYGCTKKFL